MINDYEHKILKYFTWNIKYNKLKIPFYRAPASYTTHSIYFKNISIPNNKYTICTTYKRVNLITIKYQKHYLNDAK